MTPLRTTALVLLAGAPLLAACAAGGGPAGTPGDPGQAAANGVAPGEPFELAVGESAGVAGHDLTVRFVAVHDDSRCPEGVQCIWQGDAGVELDVDLGGPEIRMVLHTGEEPFEAEAGELTLRVVGLQPPKVAGEEIAQGDYVVTLVAEE